MRSNLSLCPELCFLEQVDPALRISVIVPAKNEAGFIGATLDALRVQVDGQGRGIPFGIYEVLLLANNCSDDTLAICQSYQARYPDFHLYVMGLEIPAESAHIGTARRLLMDAAHERLISVVGSKGIIVSTDADSEVDPQWIHQILVEMEQGVDVVGGRILPLDTPGPCRIHHLRDVGYRLLRARLESALDPCPFNPWPRHFQCYGPSVAVTCEIYERAGRIPAIPFLEDEEFRKALKRVDAKIRHSPGVRIYTSSRLRGRVDFGFSVQLQKWAEMTLNNEQQMVESLEGIIYLLAIKRDLRSLWSANGEGRDISTTINALAFRLGLDRHELDLLLNSSPYFEPLWEKVEKLITNENPGLLVLQPISVAIQAFRSYFSNDRSLLNKEIVMDGEAIAV